MNSSRAIAASSLAVLLAAKAPGEPFVFVALPDTQVYAEDRVPDGRLPAVTDLRGTGEIFFDQTRWIVENAGRLDIRYVGHLGDIVQDGNDLGEWTLAHDAMHLLLDADVPHGTVMGNHDDNHGPDYQRNYLDHFGPQRFADRPWFTASSPGGGANLQILEHRHRKIGFLNFSIDHPQSEIDWATEIVASNPDTIFVIGTHRYLYDLKLAGGRYGEEIDTLLGRFTLDGGPVPGAVDPNTAQELFEKFVSRHPNILMIHAGHFHSEWLRLDGVTPEARTLIQVLTDYQSTRNGGDGWLRIYRLDFDANTFGYETWSPTLDRRRTTLDHFVETIALGFQQREEIAETLGVPVGVYLAFLGALFGEDPNVPDGFLLQHPDFDEPAEQAYYQQYLNDLFLGTPPAGFEDILRWERLWMLGFAADPSDPFDFRDSVRSPSFTLGIDYADYFTPSPQQRIAFAFEDLLAALRQLPDDFALPPARRQLLQRVEQAWWHAEAGRLDQARQRLEQGVLPRLDGCAERGEPDGLWRSMLSRGSSRDWIVSCDAQAAVHPLAAAASEALDSVPAARRGPRGRR